MRREWRGACGVLALLIAVAVVIVGPPRRLGRAGAASAAPACTASSYGVHRYAPGRGRTVALTFDDGPGASTGQLMQALAVAHVEATFFNVGGLEAGHPRLVRRAQAMGFALGDHTWSHARLTGLDADGQAEEIDRERTKQADLTGRSSCLLRPPYGDYDDTTLRLAKDRGMTVWNWSVDTQDWQASGSSDPYWVNRIVSRAKAGGAMRHPVILMHNAPAGNPATVAALPAIVKYYRVHGYRFVDLYGRTGHPVIRRVSPASGPTSGGTRVTIHGHGFVGVRRVRFGHALGRSVHVTSPGELTVITPAHARRLLRVRVVTTFGSSPPGAQAMFRYVRDR